MSIKSILEKLEKFEKLSHPEEHTLKHWLSIYYEYHLNLRYYESQFPGETGYDETKL